MRSTHPLESGDDSGIKVTNETTPLLAVTAEEAEPIDEPIHKTNSQDDESEKPLPVGQIFLLCFARFVEPIAFFSIFPYINEMIHKTGNIPEADVGFYSGLIVSNALSPKDKPGVANVNL